jgi:hypothetical protein
MERSAITPGWKLVSIGLDGEPVTVDDVDLWKHEWRRCSESITVAHPSYPAERHTMFVYELVLPARRIKFAAGEFSNGVWGFFLPGEA